MKSRKLMMSEWRRLRDLGRKGKLNLLDLSRYMNLETLLTDAEKLSAREMKKEYAR